MIKIVNPGWLSMAVDTGRIGYGSIGVPSSAALDAFACKALNSILGNDTSTPALEIMGGDFSVELGDDVTCAVTGAKVAAYLDGAPMKPWTSVRARKGGLLRVRAVMEGFRYYFGVSGTMVLERAMGSFTTNLECRFGGYRGRPLMKGDTIELRDARLEEERSFPEEFIPPVVPPHVLHTMRGPEVDYFTPDQVERMFEKTGGSWYIVSTKSNRTGLRLEGDSLTFSESAEKSIISEGIVPGTVQVPGDGQPIIMLHERTIGGYARVGLVAKADLDLLAHLKPKDKVRFEGVNAEEAEALWRWKVRTYYDKLPV
jgi:antagonist of KipI